MNKIITSIRISNLKNETHVQFHENIDGTVVKFNPDALGLRFLYDPYKTALNNETSALDFIVKNAVTVQINEQDRKRDATFRGFSDTVRGAQNHFDPECVKAANLLHSIFKHYGNIAKKTFDDETAAINDLVRELNLPANAQALALLNLRPWCDKLVEENTRFAALMTERYVETAGKTPFRMKTARVETDKYYHAIVAQIENQALGGIAVNEAFVKELNAIIERFKRILTQETAERKSKDD
jgi:hypothetical protein